MQLVYPGFAIEGFFCSPGGEKINYNLFAGLFVDLKITKAGDNKIWYFTFKK